MMAATWSKIAVMSFLAKSANAPASVNAGPDEMIYGSSTIAGTKRIRSTLKSHMPKAMPLFQGGLSGDGAFWGVSLSDTGNPK